MPGTIPSASLDRANPQAIFAYLSERYGAEHYPGEDFNLLAGLILSYFIFFMRINKAYPFLQRLYFALAICICDGFLPDTILHCLGHRWKLHEPFIHKSNVLAGLYCEGKLEKFPLPPENICEEKVTEAKTLQIFNYCDFECWVIKH